MEPVSDQSTQAHCSYCSSMPLAPSLRTGSGAAKWNLGGKELTEGSKEEVGHRIHCFLIRI